MMYKNKEQVTVVGVHIEDPGDPYYTVLTKKGREKQTTAAHLSPLPEEELESPGSMSGSCCERVFCKTETGPTTPSAHDCHDPLSHCDDIVSLKETLRSIRDSLGQEWVTEMYERLVFTTQKSNRSYISVTHCWCAHICVFFLVSVTVHLCLHLLL